MHRELVSSIRSVMRVNPGLRLRRPTAGVVRQLLEDAGGAALTHEPVGLSGLDVAPPGFRRDHWVRRLGSGEETFDAAVEVVQTWQAHRGAGLVVCVDGPPVVGLVVGMGAPLPLGYVDAVCRVVAVIDEPFRFGFAYGTLPTHPERGEESFVVLCNADGTVDFEVTAISQPRHPLARLCPPLARRLQRSATARYLDAMTRAVLR